MTSSTYCGGKFHISFFTYPVQICRKRQRLGCVNSPPPAARGTQEAGFTQPNLNLFLHFCTKRLVDIHLREKKRFPAANFTTPSSAPQKTNVTVIRPLRDYCYRPNCRSRSKTASSGENEAPRNGIIQHNGIAVTAPMIDDRYMYTRLKGRLMDFF